MSSSLELQDFSQTKDSKSQTSRFRPIHSFGDFKPLRDPDRNFIICGFEAGKLFGL